MSNTHDYSLANANGSTFRQDLNNVLADIESTNSGASEPSTTVANKLWIDTSNSKIKIRNGSNNGWIVLGDLATNMGHATSATPEFAGTLTSGGDIVCNSTGRLKLPAGTTAQRPSSPSPGDTRWNTTLTQQETYTGSVWERVGGIPSGSVVAFASESVPTGYLECNGDEVSRTTYAQLFAAIGTRFGAGNTSSTFHLPDLRGGFVRGWDHGANYDPDAEDRTNSGDGTTGDKVGTKQDSLNKSHSHSYTDPLIGLVAGFESDDSGNVRDLITQNAGTTLSSGGSESRPINIALMYVIKY
tara:strand:+ start:905 stop:1804 length:900 start_codon:yes stop_codon:yes gene_type:complete